MKGLRGSLFASLITGMMVMAMLIGGGFLKPAISLAQPKDSTCHLNSPAGNIQHVIYVNFDNVHFTRDNPNVPSDLEQMPNLLNFIQNNGTLLSNQHTPLIAHTGTDILTTLTGVYPDHHGVAVSNSYRYFNPDGSTSSTPAFSYWTSPISSASGAPYNMLSAPNTNAPAPWVPYTRAGCNFGGVAMANTILENTNLDIPAVFGANSPEAAEAKSNSSQAFIDFVGIGVHCAQGASLCSTANSGKSDVLPNEPGGYTGYMGLFGHKYVVPQISPNGPLTDLNGNVIIDSQTGRPGFPGFDGMSASVSLAYVAAMQEHGVPVTYAYISDAHDAHTANGRAFGPGEAGYVAALKAYDAAFGKFFARLTKDGITAHNTLFVFTADENDHFVGGPPSPTNCNGITTPCTYSKIGEVNANLTGLLATQQNITTPFTVHADSAPAIYLTGDPARNASVTRSFERGVSNVTATNPISGNTEKITNYLADPVELQLLHMVTADPARTPSLILFAKPDYFLFAGAPNCNTPCVTENPSSAWNHGDVAPDINRTWLGLVGPGVRHLQVNNSVWADHTDTRPTILLLLGLRDDYRHDGRAILEVLDQQALPAPIRNNLDFFTRLGQIYKQINAPVGDLGLATLHLSTTALASNSTNDQTYVKLEQAIQTITTQRNTLASQMIAALEDAEFGNHTSSSNQGLLDQSNGLLNNAHTIDKSARP
ncbi:MAG TPA: hypothetical protein VFB12_08005 [Ktedonobacteraceae bacterium]|nr:hypothetical protein [Ktedonobacteraceae bacterium]